MASLCRRQGVPELRGCSSLGESRCLEMNSRKVDGRSDGAHEPAQTPTATAEVNSTSLLQESFKGTSKELRAPS